MRTTDSIFARARCRCSDEGTSEQRCAHSDARSDFGVIVRGEIASWSGASRSRIAKESRAALNVSSDRPVIMSGHQAALWHPGILAKRFAASAFAEMCGGSAAWIVVDSDTNDGGAIAYPSRGADGRPSRSVWKWLENGVGDLTGVPLCGISSSDLAGLPARELVWNQDFCAGLERARASLSAAKRDSQTAAQQLTIAMDALLSSVADGARSRQETAVSISYATQLSRTPIFERLWNAMIADPVACVRAYNAAAARFRGSGIRELSMANGVELPVWMIEKGRRKAVRIKSAAEARAIDVVALAPRALMLTAVLRLGICDVFIHGLGGEVYDRVMEAWLGGWLATVGDEELRALTLSPSIAVSATMRLEFDGVAVPTPGDIERAVWAAQHAWHNPGWAIDVIQREVAESEVGHSSLSNEVLAAALIERKRSRVAAIAEGKGRGEALPQYRSMHAELEESRKSAAGAIDAMGRRAEAVRSLAWVARVVHDRTWSVALHTPGRLRLLADEVSRRTREVYAGIVQRGGVAHE